MAHDLDRLEVRILEQLEGRRLEEAGRGLLELQCMRPEKADTWTLTATRHLLRNEEREAEEALRRAHELAPDRFEPRLLLADLYRRTGRAEEAALWYEKAREVGGEVHREFLLDAPPAKGSRPVVRRKLAVICGPDANFIRPIEERLQAWFEVRPVHFDETPDLEAVQEAMDWADVTWFEWCDQLLITASKRLRKSGRVICRLHSYEVFTQMPSLVDWRFVDHVIFVAPHIERIFKSTLAEHLVPSLTTSVVPNGVDVDRFAFVEHERGFNVAYVGYINYKKNPELLLQVMAALVRRDPRYTLHIAGKFQDLRYALYFEKMIPALGLQEHVRFDGWVEDIDGWLQDKDYLISTSVLESFGMGIAEAMARGIKPVIHNWVGAEEVYPEDLLFNTVDEAVEQIVEPAYDARRYRTYIEERYALDRQVSLLRAILEREAGEGRSTESSRSKTETMPFEPGALRRMVGGIRQEGRRSPASAAS